MQHHRIQDKIKPIKTIVTNMKFSQHHASPWTVNWIFVSIMIGFCLLYAEYFVQWVPVLLNSLILGANEFMLVISQLETQESLLLWLGVLFAWDAFRSQWRRFLKMPSIAGYFFGWMVWSVVWMFSFLLFLYVQTKEMLG
jgi:hypothetical protein